MSYPIYSKKYHELLELFYHQIEHQLRHQGLERHVSKEDIINLCKRFLDHTYPDGIPADTIHQPEFQKRLLDFVLKVALLHKVLHNLQRKGLLPTNLSDDKKAELIYACMLILDRATRQGMSLESLLSPEAEATLESMMKKVSELSNIPTLTPENGLSEQDAANQNLFNADKYGQPVYTAYQQGNSMGAPDQYAEFNSLAIIFVATLTGNGIIESPDAQAAAAGRMLAFDDFSDGLANELRHKGLLQDAPSYRAIK